MSVFRGNGTLTIDGHTMECGPVTVSEIRSLYGTYTLSLGRIVFKWNLLPVRKARSTRGRRLALNWRKVR